MLLSNQPIARDTGGPDACLLLHGLGGGIYELAPIASALDGFALRGPNYPGHHERSTHMEHSTWHDWYGCAEAALLELARGRQGVAVCGFSTGALLALRLAARHGALVSRLALLSPFFGVRKVLGMRPESLLAALPWAARVPRRGLSIRDPAARRAAAPLALSKTFSLVAARSAIELIGLVEQDLPRVTAPALLVISMRDSVVDPMRALVAFERLGSPVRERLLLEQSDHAVALDVERDVVVARAASFIQGKGGRS